MAKRKYKRKYTTFWHTVFPMWVNSPTMFEYKEPDIDLLCIGFGYNTEIVCSVIDAVFYGSSYVYRLSHKRRVPAFSTGLKRNVTHIRPLHLELIYKDMVRCEHP
jgi:hypothetical protein